MNYWDGLLDQSIQTATVNKEGGNPEIFHGVEPLP